ncbi:MAG: hypothetical protein KDK28_18040 [Maritimibacter sp.]|nr:hypothetical protein [Maritimibacter sp.]
MVHVKKITALLALALSISASEAAAGSAWGTSADLVTSDGNGMLCQMETYWDDGRSLFIWVNGNRYFGFSLIDTQWSLPQGMSSHVTFSFGRGRENTFPIESVSETHAIGSWDQSDAIDFLERFTGMWEMNVVFPQGVTWRVDLTGSSTATNEWVSCAEQLFDRASETPGANPFGAGAGSNPF